MRTKKIFARDLQKGMLLPEYGQITNIVLGLFSVQFGTKRTVSPTFKNEDEVEIVDYYNYEEERKKGGSQC